MGLTFGDQPLLLDDERQIHGFADWWQSLDELAGDQGPGVTSDVDQMATAWRNRTPLGAPIYPDPPAPRLHQLYWPATGATRWARGYFLAGGDAAAAIAAFNQAPKTLKWSPDGAGKTLEAKLCALTTRPVTCQTDNAQERLHLVVLTDARFFWQYSAMGNFSIGATTTWAQLLDHLATQLGVTIGASAIHSDYLQPEPRELERYGDNAALLLEAALSSVGQRLVAKLDGTFEAMTPTGSAAAQNDNRDVWVGRIAGGVTEVPLPDTVKVHFPKYVDYVPCPGEIYEKSLSGAAYTSAADGKGEAVALRSACLANYTSAGTGAAAPDNQTKLDLLANRMATDYYGWLDTGSPHYDETFVGPVPWNCTGFDDSLVVNVHREEETEVVFSVEGEDASTSSRQVYQRIAYTRVQSLAPNVLPLDNQSQDPDLLVLEPFQFGKMYDRLLIDGSALMTVYQGDPTNRDADTEAIRTHQGSEVRIRVYYHTGGPIAAGAGVYAWWSAESKRWYAAELLVPMILFRLISPLSLSGSAGAAVLVCAGGTSHAPNGEIVVVHDPYDNPGMFSGPPGYMGFAHYDAECDHWDIVYMEHQARVIHGPLNGDIRGGCVSMTIQLYSNGKFPDGTPDVCDPCGRYSASNTDTTGFCASAYWDEKSGNYYIIDLWIPSSCLILSGGCDIYAPDLADYTFANAAQQNTQCLSNLKIEPPIGLYLLDANNTSALLRLITPIDDPGAGDYVLTSQGARDQAKWKSCPTFEKLTIPKEGYIDFEADPSGAVGVRGPEAAAQEKYRLPAGPPQAQNPLIAVGQDGTDADAFQLGWLDDTLVCDNWSFDDNAGVTHIVTIKAGLITDITSDGTPLTLCDWLDTAVSWPEPTCNTYDPCAG